MHRWKNQTQARSSQLRLRIQSTGAFTGNDFSPQGYFPFRSPYQGHNSLPGGGQVRETWTATAFIGHRLWDGGEFYINPELAQGFGLASTLGLGGFSNGEAQKAGVEFPKVRAQRYFFRRQTIGLGGEQEAVEDAQSACR